MNSRLIFVALCTLGLAACGTPDTPSPTVVPVASTQRDNAGPPPPPKAELIPPAPSAYSTWTPGYWDRQGATYVWVSGRWNDPRPGQFYANAYWSQDNGVWTFHAGHWVNTQAPVGVASITATTPPPPLQSETVPVAPGSDYFWVGGNWRWQNGNYVWFPGHWEQYRYRTGQVWVPEHWETTGANQWQLVGGYWQQL